MPRRAVFGPGYPGGGSRGRFALREPSLLSAPGRDGPVPAVPVVFIAGMGRSGSTLLDRLLGTAPGFHSGGELAGIWKHGLVDDRLCSCGARFSSCPFWQAVGRGSFSSLRTDEIAAFACYLTGALPVVRMRLLLRRRARRRLMDSAPPGFFDAMARLYQGVRETAAREVVVDSSKLATYCFLLAQTPSVDVRVVHLVRDPRASAHSWLRPRVADPDGRSTMPRFGAAKSAALWLIQNAAVEWTARLLALPYVRIRYEDLVADPATVVRKVRSQVVTGHAEPGRTEADPPSDADADLGVMHSISGNPMRFRHGRVPVVEDAGWKSDPRSRRAVVAAITFPLRWRYGYAGLPGPRHRDKTAPRR